MYKKIILLSFILLIVHCCVAESIKIGGTIIDKKTRRPLESVYLVLSNGAAWTLSDGNGNFNLDRLSKGQYILEASILGYKTYRKELSVTCNTDTLRLELEEQSLRLEQVDVTAQRGKTPSASTSYKINRTALDHIQALSATDIMALLPGGKLQSDNSLIYTNSPFAIRSGGSELGYGSFGTAVEIDGVRLDNNSSFSDSPHGVLTRNLGLTNVESIEITTGIPSVEFGDLTSGIVKINTKKGKTPFTVDFSVRPHTKQIAINKGFQLGNKWGIINLSGERARSFSDLASPHTSYARNNFSLNYQRIFLLPENQKLSMNLGAGISLAEYNDKDDPDKYTNTFIKQLDNNYRFYAKARWLVNKSWLTDIEISSTLSSSDNKISENVNKSSAASIVANHSMSDGYYVALPYENAKETILLKPGYWDELSYYDSRPISSRTKVKFNLKRRYGERVFNRILLGGEFALSKNRGQGEYYDDLQYAPSWRPYVLRDVPAMHTYSIYGEDNLDLSTGNLSKLKMMLGVRADFTKVPGSIYGTVGSFSPRMNVNYIFWEGRSENVIQDMNVYAGWGKAVKLPSFGMLHSRDRYSDRLAFAPASDANNLSFMAYHTTVTASMYNPNLKWQYNQQLEIGFGANVKGSRFTLAFYKNTTKNTYTEINDFKPQLHKLTTQQHLEGCLIPEANRLYTIDKETGVVTVKDKYGVIEDQRLAYNEQKVYTTNSMYVNGNPIDRWGLEWTIDFAQIKAIKTSVRVDGNFYNYRGLNEMLIQSTSSLKMSDGSNYEYIGHYVGGNNISNGKRTKEVNTNVTLTTHIPKIRMLVSLRCESTLKTYQQSLSEWNGGERGFALNNSGDMVGNGDGFYGKDTYVGLYPEYYSTWDAPNELIPFKEKFLWAMDNDPKLYKDLAQLVEKSSNVSIFQPRTVTPYYSLSLNLTKEIGRTASISFYATNFLNNMSTVRVSGSVEGDMSLYNSSYIPKFYYGISLRLKL